MAYGFSSLTAQQDEGTIPQYLIRWEDYLIIVNDRFDQCVCGIIGMCIFFFINNLGCDFRVQQEIKEECHGISVWTVVRYDITPLYLGSSPGRMLTTKGFRMCHLVVLT